MLLSALMTARVGGKVLYCTCALSPLENDEVVERVLSRRTKEVEVLSITLPKDAVSVEGEPTRYGIQILPDTSYGAGPLYLSLLRKTPGLKQDESTG
jgi:16S rRNA C967 or C1407 C5-methylase (RsmB/RsmF family)